MTWALHLALPCLGPCTLPRLLYTVPLPLASPRAHYLPYHLPDHLPDLASSCLLRRSSTIESSATSSPTSRASRGIRSTGATEPGREQRSPPRPAPRTCVAAVTPAGRAWEGRGEMRAGCGTPLSWLVGPLQNARAAIVPARPTTVSLVVLGGSGGAARCMGMPAPARDRFAMVSRGLGAAQLGPRPRLLNIDWRTSSSCQPRNAMRGCRTLACVCVAAARPCSAREQRQCVCVCRGGSLPPRRTFGVPPRVFRFDLYSKGSSDRNRAPESVGLDF